MTEVVDVRGSRGALLRDGVASLAIWVDFGLLGLLAGFVGAALTPADWGPWATLSVLAIFAAGFFTRPIGAAWLRGVDARHGRRTAHLVVISGMTLSTALVGCLPGFDSGGFVGLGALLLLRLAQGVFAGAELRGPVAELVATTPHGRRGRYNCWPMTINLSGYAVSAATALALMAAFGSEAMAAGAWRYGFLLAIAWGALATCLRLGAPSRLVKVPMAAIETRVPVVAAADITSFRDIALTLGSVLVYNASTGAFQVGVPWVLTRWAQWPLGGSLVLALCFGAAPLCFTLFGRIADRIGHVRVMGAGALGVALLAYPCFAMMAGGDARDLVLAFAIGFLTMGMLGGSIQAFLAERLPNRSPKVQLIYALSAAIFGGTSPFIINAVALGSGDPATAAAYYLIACGIVSFACLLSIRIASPAIPRQTRKHA